MSAPALSVSAGACWPRPSPFADGAGLASARVHKKKSVIKLENGNALNKTFFILVCFCNVVVMEGTEGLMFVDMVAEGPPISQRY